MEKIKLLFVEDDASFAFVIKGSLELTGIYQVQIAANGKEGLDAYYSFNPDVIVSDIEMPVLDGMEMIKRIRRDNENIPILFATGHTDAREVLDGYKLKADNFVKKPYIPEELDAHIQAILKRIRIGQTLNNIENIQLGRYFFNINKQQLHYKNKTFKLTLRETQILYKLYENKDNLVKRDDLLNELWGINDFYSSRSLDVFVYSLRKHLTFDSKIQIETIRNKGLILSIA